MTDETDIPDADRDECTHCGKVFRHSDAEWEDGSKYCSEKCTPLGRLAIAEAEVERLTRERDEVARMRTALEAVPLSHTADCRAGIRNVAGDGSPASKDGPCACHVALVRAALEGREEETR